MSISLRRRAILGGVVWGLIAISLGSFMLFRFIDSFAVSRFDDGISTRLLQVAASFERVADTPEELASLLADPAYARPYSGLYWQVDDTKGNFWTSRSLFDTHLNVPAFSGRELAVWVGGGPTGPVRGVTRRVVLDNGATWFLTVAENIERLEQDRLLIRERLVLAFVAIGSLAILAAAAQTTLLLGPLSRLRAEIAQRWDKGERLIDKNYPEEVVPLVEELNAALDRNSTVIDRARRQAADLAHFLNTPSAILRNELEFFRSEGIDTSRADDALARIDSQITRSLARIRSAAFAGQTIARTNVEGSISRILRVIERTFETTPELTSPVDPSLFIRMDQHDFEEVFGNLLDNAEKWCESRIEVTVSVADDETIRIAIEDDGPGISEADRQKVLVEGGRLDTSKPGTGLGLAIVSDLMAAYGGQIQLDGSARLGGLSAILLVPGKRLVGSATPD